MGTTELRGITLIEILVATMLIAVAVLGLSATFIWVQGRNVYLQRYDQAMDFIKDTLEFLLPQDYNDTNLTAGSHTAESFLALPDCDLKNKFAAVRAYNVTNITEGKQIGVNITWTEEGQAKQEDLFGLVIQK